MLNQKDLAAIAAAYCKQHFQEVSGRFDPASENVRTGRAVLNACADFLNCRARNGISKKDESNKIAKDRDAFNRVLQILAPRDKPASGFVALLWNPARHADHEADARRAIAAIRTFRDEYSRVHEDLQFGDAHTGFPRAFGRAFKQEALPMPVADDAIAAYELLLIAMERDHQGSTGNLPRYTKRDANKIAPAIEAGYGQD